VEYQTLEGCKIIPVEHLFERTNLPFIMKINDSEELAVNLNESFSIEHKENAQHIQSEEAYLGFA